MSNESDRRAARGQLLSALVDGELESAAVAQLSAEWRDDRQTRAAWHAYQLIGDVLRSEDLASTARHDADFLAALRLRMASEPVVLAPQSLAGPPPAELAVDDARTTGDSAMRRRRNRFWIATSAIAAGFVMVVGASLALRSPLEGSAQIAQAGWPPASHLTGAIEQVSVGTTRERTEEAPVRADANLIRDARLDRYLAAHKQFSGSSVLGAPSGFLRDSASDAPIR